jgi:uncharacterized membrane protein HdeD (DUF308 family)
LLQRGLGGGERVWQGKQHLWGELLVWVVLAAGAYALSFEFEQPISGYRLGATAWPRMIIALIVIVALVQFAIRLSNAMRDPEAESGPGYWGQFMGSGVGANIKVGLAFGLPVLYAVLLPGTGFYLTTPLFLMAYLYLLGERRWPYLVGVALFIYGLMVLIFTTLFYVALPVGNWPVFYDINNWLLRGYR